MYDLSIYVCSCSILSIDSCIEGTVYTRQNKCVEKKQTFTYLKNNIGYYYKKILWFALDVRN